MISASAEWQLARVQNSQAYTTPSLVHKSNTWSETETPEAEGFGFICFDFYLFIYLHLVCMRGHVCAYCRGRDVEVSYDTYLKLSNLQVQYGTWEVGFTLLHRLAFVAPGLSAIWRQTLKYKSAKPLFHG